jgi:hypothetical protein
MESSVSHRSGLLTAGGVLSIIAGATEIIGGLIVVGLILVTVMQGGVLASNLSEGPILIMIPILIPTWTVVVAAALLVLGTVAIIGGVSALRLKRFGMSLAGAICALPTIILGILAIVFVSRSRKEFGG